MIDFEISPKAKEIVKMVHDFNVNVVRDLSRYYDQYEHEHDELTEDEFKMMRDHHLAVRSKMASDDKPPEGPGLMRVILGEERAWGGEFL